MKSGNLNFLKPSGPLQACNGTALHSHKYRTVYSTSNVTFKNIYCPLSVFVLGAYLNGLSLFLLSKGQRERERERERERDRRRNVVEVKKKRKSKGKLVAL